MLESCTDISFTLQIGYGRGSVFASSLYIASLSDPKLRLLGNNLEEEMEIREWVEFYCSQLKSPSPWQRTSKDRLHSSIHVSGLVWIVYQAFFSVIIALVCCSTLQYQILDTHLANRVYIAAGGMSLSVADVLVYYGLYSYMVSTIVCVWFWLYQACVR